MTKLSKDNNNEICQPDIEVYVKDITIEEILSWLDTVFSNVIRPGALDKPSINLSCQTATDMIPLTVFVGAAGKLYTSLWFQSDKTPWATDLDCATQIASATDKEVRCSTGGWKESSDTENQWWKVTKDGKTVVSW